MVEKLLAYAKKRGASDDISAWCYLVCSVAGFLAVIYGIVIVGRFALDGNYSQQIDAILEKGLGAAYGMSSFGNVAEIYASPIYAFVSVVLAAALVIVLVRFYKSSGVALRAIMTILLVASLAIGGFMAYAFSLADIPVDAGDPRVDQLLAFSSSIGVSFLTLFQYIFLVLVGLIVIIMLVLAFAPNHWLSRKVLLVLFVAYCLVPLSALLLENAIPIAVFVLIVCLSLILLIFFAGGSAGPTTHNGETGSSFDNKVASSNIGLPSANVRSVSDMKRGTTGRTEEKSSDNAKKSEKNYTTETVPRDLRLRRHTTIEGYHRIEKLGYDDVWYGVCSQADYDRGKIKIIDENGNERRV